MAGERSYVQVPPDSTGKKIRHEPHQRVSYDTRVGNHIWQLGEEYVIDRQSGADLTVVVYAGPNADSGNLGVRFQRGDDFNNETIASGDLIKYGGSTVATVTGTEIITVPYVNIAGKDFPNNAVNVDAFGSMQIRFDEGRPQLDAFGRLRVSSGTTLGDYNFQYDTLPLDFSTKIVGRATATHQENERRLKLNIPSGGTPGENTVDSAGTVDSVLHTTNTYHHYYPGFSQTAIMTVALGDTGVANVTRNWGYFDEDNGYMFRVDDATNKLKCVIRSKVTGSVVETVVAQADFNVDKVDGSSGTTNNSLMDLDVTDDNIYWIDVQWLGAGRVRFGTYFKGQRIVMHEHYNLNNGGAATTQAGSLPISFEQKYDSGSPQSGLGTEVNMFAWCSAVHTEHEVDISKQGRNRLETFTRTFNPASITNSADYELVGVLAPVITLDDDHVNRGLFLPNYMETMAYHANGDEALVELEIYVNPVIGGGNTSFSINSDEVTVSPAVGPYLKPVEARDRPYAVESYQPQKFYDAGDAVSDLPQYYGGGSHVLAKYIRGRDHIDLSGQFSDFQGGAFKNFSNNGGTQTHNVGSWTVGSTTSYQAGGDFLQHREGSPIKFVGIGGTLGDQLNYDGTTNTEFFLKVTSANTAELYEDKEFQTAVNTTGKSASGTNGQMSADYGTQLFFVIVCKPLQPTIDKKNASPSDGDVTVHFNLGWSEVLQ